MSLVRNRHDAEDIVQEACRRLFARAGHYDLPRDGIKLLYRSITNACINLSQRRRPTVSVDSVSNADVVNRPGDSGPEGRLLAGELHEMVAQALSELPVNQRAVMELSSLGYSAAEIAEIVDLSDVNTRQLLHRAREAMKLRLQPYLEGKSS